MVPISAKARQARRYKLFLKRIEDSNAAFKRAGAAERIVMVAKDVLDMLDLKRIRAVHGTYVEQHGVTMPAGCQISDILKLPHLPSCHVCAIGGAMVASTLRLNDVLYKGPAPWPSRVMHHSFIMHHSFMDGGMSDRARDVFPEALLLTMEQAFELGAFGYSRIRNGTECLRAIYQNLIDNNGRKFTSYGYNETLWSLR